MNVVCALVTDYLLHYFKSDLSSDNLTHPVTVRAKYRPILAVARTLLTFTLALKKTPLFPLSQKLRNFHSLSCLGVTGEDSCESTQTLVPLRSMAQPSTDHLSVNDHALEDIKPQTKEGRITRNMSADPTIEEAEWSSTDYADVMHMTTIGKESEPLWSELCSMRKDVHQLGGELDIEQIERN